MIKRRLELLVNKIFSSQKTFFVLAFVLLIMLSIPVFKNLSARYRINQEIKGLEQNIKQTQNKNSELQKLLTYLQSDQFIEEQARENLGLKKEGEEVVVVKGISQTEKKAVDGNSVFTIAGLDKTPAAHEDNGPQKWFKYFVK